MHIEDLIRDYSAKSDEELLELASESGELTSMAQTALTNELAKRRIDVAEQLKALGDEDVLSKPEQLGILANQPRHDSYQVSQFVVEVLTVYHSHFWLFVRLVAPAVIIGYIAVFTGRSEGREIARYIPRGVEGLEHKTEMLESILATQLGFFISWVAFSISFGAICSALGQIAAGFVPHYLANLPTAVFHTDRPYRRCGPVVGERYGDIEQASSSSKHSGNPAHFFRHSRIGSIGFLTVWSRGACRNFGQLQSWTSHLPQRRANPGEMDDARHSLS